MKPSYPILGLSFAALGYASMAGPRPAEVNFGRDVKPIISQPCYKCHGPDASKAAAGLRLDSFEGATKNLGDGAAIVPKNPAKSLILERVSEKDPAMRMPPQNAGVTALTAEQIETLKTWIAAGAKYEKHWSFVPPAMPPIPRVS